MADGRMLKATIAHDARVAQLSDASALLYVMAIPHLDDEGRMVGSPVRVRGAIVPARAETQGWTDEHIEGLIDEWQLTTDSYGQVRPLVHRYDADGVTVLWFPGFRKNQTLRRPARSLLPPPPPGWVTPGQLEILVAPEGKRSEGKGTEPLAGVKPPAGADPLPSIIPCRASSPALQHAATGGASQAAAAGPNGDEPPADDAHTPSEPWLEVYEHWRAARGKTRGSYERVTDQRREKIQARLQRFSVEELKRAIDAVALDPWPDRVRHDDLTKIFRSHEAVDRWLDLAENGTHVNGYANRRLAATRDVDLGAYTRV